MLRRFTKQYGSKSIRHRGVALIGYGLIIALLSIATMAATSQTGRHLADCVFPAISSALDGDGFQCHLGGPGDPADPGDEDEEESWIAFAPVYDAEPAALVVSEPATAEGFSGSLAASVTGPAGSIPEFSVDGGAWSTTGDVSAGSDIRLRARAADAYSQSTEIAFQLGDTTARWQLHTAEPEEGTEPQWLVDPVLPKGFIVVGDYSLLLQAQADIGSTISFYEFVSGELPPGFAYDEEGSHLSGNPEEIGTYSFTLAVEDTRGRRSERTFFLEVQEAPPLASSIAPNRIHVSGPTGGTRMGKANTLEMAVLGGESDPGNRYDLNSGATIEFIFDEVVLMDQLHVEWAAHYSNNHLEAVIGDETQPIHLFASTGGSTKFSERSVHFPLNEMVASDRFRISVNNDLAFKYLRFGEANPWPEWVTPEGAVAIANGTAQEIQLEATSESPWNPSLSFELAAESELPAGVSLSPHGLLEISPSTRLDHQANFTVEVHDGVGFYVERVFALLPDQPLASEVSPSGIRISGPTGGSRMGNANTLEMAVLGGESDPSNRYNLSSGTTLEFVFDEVVLMDQLHVEWAAHYSNNHLEAVIGDETQPIHLFSSTGGSTKFSERSVHFPINEMVASDRFRISVNNGLAFKYLRFGEANPWPEWVTPAGAVAIANGTAQEIQLEATSESPWNPSLSFELAAESELPAGVSLSPHGLLEISPSTRLDHQANFTVEVHDGVGFYVERVFALLPDQPLASEVSPSGIRISGPTGGSRMGNANTLEMAVLGGESDPSNRYNLSSG